MAPLLHLRDVALTFGGQPLLEAAEIAVSAGERVCLVGRNGSGKSTLLKIAAGLVEPDHAERFVQPGSTIRYLPQEPDFTGFDTALAYVEAGLGPGDDAYRAQYLLTELGLTGQENPASMSGGEGRRAALARVLAPEPDILLLDEPTNHLDLAKIAQLEDWLNTLPRDVPVVICSHDRAFLDATTNRTLFLRPENSHAFALPYTRARVALDEIDAAEARRYERDMKVAQQLRQQAAKLNNIGINSGSDLLVVKTKQLKQRAEKLEDAARPAHQERSAGAIRLANSGTHAKVLVTLDDASVETPDATPLFKTGRKWICQGDRIVLLGANGTGKSRLVGMIRRAITDPLSSPDTVKATPSLVLGYGDQALADLPDRDTPFDTISRRFDIGDQRTRTLLAGAGLGIDIQNKPNSVLSGGQKARLGMLVLRLANPNFFLLDEPTNHLDIDGQEALESELMAHEASCLLVSHDRSFVRAIGNRFWLIEKRRLVEVESPEAFFASVNGTSS